MLLHAVPLAAVLFVLFPRLPGPLWAVPGSGSAATGLSETMSPGDITELGLSDEVAFRVDFASTPPTADKLYWRGPVLTNFNGRTWSRAEGMRRAVRSTVTYEGEPVTYRVMLEPNGRGWAFALDMPQSWSADRNLRMNSDYQLATFFGERSPRFDYQVTSYPEYVAREPLTTREIARFTALPADFNPRTRALVASWQADHPAAEVVIERALDYLRSQEFYYTLTPPPLGRDSVDEFLFETREGFCEHYAAAFAFMLRVAGLPARVVTGYQGGELNGVSLYYVVRQSDAHAWTEVWLTDRGWVRVDPITAVAPERVALGSARTSLEGAVLPGGMLSRIGWLRGAGQLWDAAHSYWNEWVIGYGPGMQRALLEWLGFRDLRWSERWATLLGLTLGATVALLALFSLFLAWRHRRRRAHDPAVRCFERFCRTLARAAVASRAPHESPAAYGRRAQHALPAAAAEIDAIVAAYLRARYEPDHDRAALHELERRVGDFRPARA
jgi:transglutaminase-like putative cysteine protease